MKINESDYLRERGINIKEELLRYYAFWPIFLTSIFIFIAIAYVYLRYADYKFESSAKIEIIDKSQDSEMALPTAMTIFNRSMINLENETGVLSSHSLHKKVVSSLNYNVKYFKMGLIKTSEKHKSELFKNYKIDFNIDLDTITNQTSFHLFVNDSKLNIQMFNKNDSFIKEYSFENLSTYNKKHNLPFDIEIEENNTNNEQRIIRFLPIDESIETFKKLVQISPTGQESDQLDLKMKYPNKKICDEYLNTLISEFDKDGITDRQLEYKRTIDFVDTRSVFLRDELQKIELSKQEFKEKNNLTDIKVDANVNINQRYAYDSDLFNAQSQRDLIKLLNEALNENNYQLMPLNIGLENSEINTLISEYNLMIKERDKYLIGAGLNNAYVKNLEKQIMDFSSNIQKSIENYKNSLDITINNLNSKEREYASRYKSIPENEKILRSIERELEIKESLFLLLLQKKEEAAINFAVVKPSIKVIDYARSLDYPVSPNKFIIYTASIFLGLFLPFLALYIFFITDSKIHNRDDISSRLSIPIIGEIPHVEDVKKTNTILKSTSRDPLAESIRMIIANLNFILFNKKTLNNTILVTSSIKGEGKTIVSTNIASVLSSKFDKILLIGADLRNPQIHKFLKIEKNIKGLSDYIHRNDLDWKKLLLKHENLDVLLSGTIPPNPTELLSSTKFSNFIEEVKKFYDYVVIDSAPCVLVSDTFEISKHIDTTIYVLRSNFSEFKLCNFIKECKDEGKLSNINLVLNAVGNSKLYGYSYGYQYGYQYGYRYGYNYGYGYGYSKDDT